MSGIVINCQQVSITIAANATSNTATLPIAVNSAYSAVFWGGSSYSSTLSNNPNFFNGNVVLTPGANTTTVTANRAAADTTGALTINATVVQFASYAIKSIQAGSVSMGSLASGTAAISAVTLANAAVIYNGLTVVSTAASRIDYDSGLTLTSTTQVTATRNSAGASGPIVYFTVLEFATGILNSSAQQNTVATSGSNSGTTTITGVTASNAMLAYGGQTNSTDGYMDSALAITLTNGTTVTASSQEPSGGSSIAYFTVLEFKTPQIKSVNRGEITIAAAATTNTATIAAVLTTAALTNFTGWNGNNGSVNLNPGSGLVKIVLTNPTTITATRGVASGSQTAIGAWEIIEFVPYTGSFLLMF